MSWERVVSNLAFEKLMELIVGEASYADFIVVGMLHFFKVLDEDIYGRVVKAGPDCGKLYEACKQWLERDDH